jgi:hypothetical protein
LPLGKTPTAEELRRVEATGRLREAMTQMFHAKARPAAEKLREIVSGFATALKERPEPYYTLGLMVEMYTLPGSERAENKLRTSLEGVAWDMDDEASEVFRRFVMELDNEKQTPHSLGLDLYFFYSNYRLLSAEAKRLARVVDMSQDLQLPVEVIEPMFKDWQRLDLELTSRLREVLASTELANLRDDFEERITKWS